MKALQQLSFVALVAICLIPKQALGQGASYPEPLGKKFVIDDNDPEAHLPTEEEAAKSPLEWGYLLMALDERAQIASERGDWNATLKYHRAAAKLVPDRAVSFGMLCKDYEMVGKRDEAVLACAKATTLPGTKVDYFVRFVHLVANRPGGVKDAEVEDALAAVEHLKSDKNTALTGFELECELSLQTRDESALERCSKELSKRAPKAPRTAMFGWALAIQQRKFERAHKLIDTAKRNGASTEVIAKMETATRAAAEGKKVGAADALESEKVPASDSDRGASPSSSGTSSHSALPTAHDHDGNDDGGGGASTVTRGVSSTASSVPHPMLQWFAGLAVAFAMCLFVARRVLTRA